MRAGTAVIAATRKVTVFERPRRRFRTNHTRVEAVVIAAAEAVDPDVLTLCQEFIALPALCLTVQQVARWLNVRTERAVDVLTELERDGFLIRAHNGAFRRAQPPMA